MTIHLVQITDSAKPPRAAEIKTEIASLASISFDTAEAPTDTPFGRAFAEGLKEYGTELLQAACRIVGRADVAQDVFQDVCARLLESGQVDAPDNMRSFLHTCVVHRAADYMRQEERRGRLGLPEEAETKLNRIPAPDDTAVAEALEEVEAAFPRLPAAMRAALAAEALKAVPEETAPELSWLREAASANEPVEDNAARVRLCRARKKLVEIISQ